MKISQKIKNIFSKFQILIFARGGYERSGDPRPKFKGISGKKKKIEIFKKSFSKSIFWGNFPPDRVVRGFDIVVWCVFGKS